MMQLLVSLFFEGEKRPKGVFRPWLLASEIQGQTKKVAVFHRRRFSWSKVRYLKTFRAPFKCWLGRRDLSRIDYGKQFWPGWFNAGFAKLNLKAGENAKLKRKWKASPVGGKWPLFGLLRDSCELWSLINAKAAGMFQYDHKDQEIDVGAGRKEKRKGKGSFSDTLISTRRQLWVQLHSDFPRMELESFCITCSSAGARILQVMDW